MAGDLANAGRGIRDQRRFVDEGSVGRGRRELRVAKPVGALVLDEIRAPRHSGAGSNVRVRICARISGGSMPQLLRWWR